MTMITPSYLGETIEYSSLHACRSTLEDPTHGALYAAMADAGLILGLALWKLRVALTRIPDNTAPFFLQDSIRHSVFFTGFRLKNVLNPALAEKSTEMQVNPQR